MRKATAGPPSSTGAADQAGPASMGSVRLRDDAQERAPAAVDQRLRGRDVWINLPPEDDVSVEDYPGGWQEGIIVEVFPAGEHPPTWKNYAEEDVVKFFFTDGTDEWEL